MYRYRSQAYRTASERTVPLVDARANTGGPLLPTHSLSKYLPRHEAGGLDSDHGRGGYPSRPSPGPLAPGSSKNAGKISTATADDRVPRDEHGGFDASPTPQLDNATGSSHNPEESNRIKSENISTSANPPPTASQNTEDASAGHSTIGEADVPNKPKRSIPTRMKEGSLRFVGHFKDAIFHSWVNVLLIAVPAGIAVKVANLNAPVVFAINAVAIIPLAGLLTHATESVASRLGDTLGALLNVSFGNAVELIIFIIALVKNEITIVQASLLGSILANLLLILGMAFLFGGLRFQEQIYNNTVTQMSACLLSLSVISLLLPTAFHASFSQQSIDIANTKILEVSRGTSIVLLIVYILYLLFQLRSHAYMYESTPQAIIDEESHPGVLADIMNSSSSSESSTDSDSSDSDSDGSGSVAATTRRVRRMFKNRRRRKSSVSNGSNNTENKSVLSSPSTQERQDYLEKSLSPDISRHPSGQTTLNSPDEIAVEGDKEDNGVSRRYDWATQREISHDGSKSPEPRKRHKKKSSKKRRKHRHEQRDDDEKIEQAAEEGPRRPTVGFVDDVEVVENTQVPQTSSRLPFNMRQFSSRTTRVRPVMQKMLSNNVFAQPPAATHAIPAASARPVPNRPQSAGNLRRTTSLPDRLNRQNTTSSMTATRADPLPPYQHQRYPLRKTPVEHASNAEASEDGEPEQMSRTAATVLLLCSTALVAVCAEFLVDAIPAMIGNGDNGVSEAFIGLIILPIVGNAAEHVTAVTVATKNKMDLAIGVAVGSSIQIALFVTPVVVLLGWILNTNMSLYFNLFETVSLFATVFVVNFLVLDGRSNYLEGTLLIAAYVIIAIIAFFYPSTQEQSSLGGGNDSS